MQIEIKSILKGTDNQVRFIEFVTDGKTKLLSTDNFKKSRATANPTNVSPVTDPHSTLGGGAGRSFDNSIANKSGKSQDLKNSQNAERLFKNTEHRPNKE